MPGIFRSQIIHPRRDNPLLIGCAGWSVPGKLQEHFPPDGSHLERYAAVLPAVEINTSFYRPHRPETYARWHDSVPESFRFSVKVPRSITHEHRLIDTDALLSRFLAEAGKLGEKLGCLLVQLPPSLRFDAQIATAFFNDLATRTAVPIVCEARHLTWFSAAADEVLEALGIAHVMADPPVTGASVSMRNSQIAYVRLHGAPVMYHSNYSDDILDRLAAELRQAATQGQTAWCIFDNTASGAAMPNALSLLSRFDESTP